MRKISYLEAIREGFASGMRKDPGSFIVGEGIAARGGCFAQAKGLYEKFGPERVLDMPISESAFVGMCAGAHHSQSFHSWFMNIPGIKVVMPSTPYDVKGLLAGAILDDNPVLVLEHRALLNIKEEVPEEDYVIPLGEARLLREGADVTIVAAGLMVHHALKAAEILAGRDISAEVIDLRTLAPLDEEAIIDSVKKTGRLLIVDEGYAPCGLGAEIAFRVQHKVFDYLDAPIGRLHTAGAPVPYSPPLEQYIVQYPGKIVGAVVSMM